MKVMYKFAAIACLSSVISFYVGMKYEQVSRHRQEILIFANVLGDQVIENNHLISSFGVETKDEIERNYNLSILNDVGCSVWLAYLKDFTSKDFSTFSAGIGLALKKIDSQDKENNICINNILSFKEAEGGG